MADTFSAVIKEVIGFIRESSAVIHYFSDAVVFILIYNTIFEHGVVVTVIIWVVIALISASIAELLKSRLPTPLRVIFRRKTIT